MKVVGVVVAYFPDLKELTFNISSYVNELDKLIIWDNTPNQAEDYFAPVIEEKYKDKIRIMTTGKNEGIGYALNQAAQWGINNHFDYLLTMDQDSNFAEGSLLHYLRIIQKTGRRDVVMYTSMLRLVSGDSPPFEGEFLEQKLGITSGSIMPLSVFEELGFFQEELFIEGVDLEMCWRAKKHQLKVLQVNHVYLNHAVGDRKEFNFLGEKLHTYNYSPIRVYYSIRNHIYLYKKYKDHAFFIHYFYNNVFKRAIAILLLESDRRKKLYALFLGAAHGLEGKLGAYSFR
jgi:rhamnosyltransferase